MTACCCSLSQAVTWGHAIESALYADYSARLRAWQQTPRAERARGCACTPYGLAEARLGLGAQWAPSAAYPSAFGGNVSLATLAARLHPRLGLSCAHS